MKKDTKSYNAHNAEYETTSDLDWSRDRFQEYDKFNYFEVLGFKKIIKEYSGVTKRHVDVGSGAGWLLAKTAPYFECVIGIEPSAAAVRIAKHFTQQFENVEYIESDMIKGLASLNLIDPTLFTTSTVLSHIEDDEVAQFLKLLNTAPVGSVLFFREPYGKNRQQYLWHIRSREWWARHLPQWNLTFCGYEGNGYLNGIKGVCVGSNKVVDRYVMGFFERIIWHISGIPSRFKYLGRVLFFRDA